MATFGIGTKFGVPTKFGAEFIDPPVPFLEVDWQKRGLFLDGADKAISSYYANAGRSYYLNSAGDGFEEDDTGKIKIVLENLDDRYTFTNKTGAFYPYVQAGKRFRLRVRYGYTVYPVAIGTITDIVNYSDDAGRKFVRFDAENDWRKLRSQSRGITIALQTGVGADDVINTVLDAASWPNARSIDNGADTFPYWWSEGENAASLIYGIAHAEMGIIYLTADGTLTFLSRYNTSTPVFTLNPENINIDSLSSSKPTENVRTLVSVSAQPIYLTSLTALWTLSGQLTLGVSGDSASAEEMWGEYTYNSVRCAAQSIVSPVATTDYTANTSSDGSGTDKTAFVTVTVTSWASRFKLTVTNTSGVAVYVTLLKIRGYALARGNTSSFELVDLASIYEQAEFGFGTTWLQSNNAARQIASTLFLMLSAPRLIHSFEVSPDDYALTLGMDTGLRVDVSAEDAGVYGSYRIIRTIQEYDATSGKPFTAKITVEPIITEVIGGSSMVPLLIPFTAGA